jgi:hypothetical protein
MSFSHRLLTIGLLLGTGTFVVAQAQDSSIDKSVVQLTYQSAPGYRTEYFRALLISEKGLILTPWRNVCMASTFSCSLASMGMQAKLIGVHPTRDLALLQIDLSTGNNQNAPKPVKLATAPLSLGDKVFLYQSFQPTPAIVSSETEPGGNPEYFWMTARDSKAGAPWPGGWPGPDNWVMNLQGEVQGVVARVLVNGRVSLRAIPVHDIRPEDFVSPAQRRPNTQKALELIQLADEIERDRAQNRYRPVPFGTYQPDVQECLRMAHAEDPTNKDLNFRMGIIREDSKANPAPDARSLPDPTAGKSGDQVDVEFIRSRVATAIEHLKAGRTKLGEDILKDIVATFPKNPETKAARQLLESIQSPK